MLVRANSHMCRSGIPLRLDKHNDRWLRGIAAYTELRIRHLEIYAVGHAKAGSITLNILIFINFALRQLVGPVERTGEIGQRFRTVQPDSTKMFFRTYLQRSRAENRRGEREVGVVFCIADLKRASLDYVGLRRIGEKLPCAITF